MIFFITVWNIKGFAQSWDFNYNGGVQSWTCPTTGTYKLETWGAQAGYDSFSYANRDAQGAQGGYVAGTINLTQGTTLYICVGGRGGRNYGGLKNEYYGGDGGYNGGGKGGTGLYFRGSGNYLDGGGGGSGGGGATHIATTNRRVLSNYVSNQNEVLIVAAGGGGCGYGMNGSTGGSANKLYQFGQGQNGPDGDRYSSNEGGGGGGGGWYGGAYGGAGHEPSYGGSHYTSSQLSNVTKQNGGRDGNGFARITSMHTHNSFGIEYNQGNDAQHIKYTYCNGHGSDHSQNRSGGTWENHSWATTRDWYNYDNTTMHQDQKCSQCGKTRVNSKVRYYNVNLNILDPNDTETRDGGYGYGYVKVSLDNASWSDEITNETSFFTNRQYGEKIYIKYTRPYSNHLEFGSISVTNNKGLTDLGNNVWCYTVSDNAENGYAGGVITIHMDYKHTTLTLDPNGGTIDGKTAPQALSPRMQYLSGNWWNVSGYRPSRQCYIFNGWYDKASGGTKVYNADGSCVPNTAYFNNSHQSLCVEDLTVYAQWTENHQDANNDGACDHCGKVYRSRHKLIVNGCLNGTAQNTVDPFGTFTLKIDGRDIITATKWSDYIADGTSYTITPTAKTGYKYMGVTGKLSQTMPASDQIVRLSFDNLYTIVFNGNFTAKGVTGKPTGGSTSSMTNIPYTTTKNLTANDFYRHGYTFKCWNTKSDGTGTSYSDKQSVSKLSATPNGTVTLYAEWQPVTYHIYYTLFGSSATVARSYTIESAAFILPKPSLNGYIFKGWIGGIDKKDSVRDASGKTYSTPTGNITIPKGTYGDYFFRAVFEKNHSSVNGDRTDDAYVAHSEVKEKQY